ncbi:hypothetical protein [Azospirillum sp. B2RO_4]|uniref:hypothetical protein n=1 Tax=Azospirillum sp. B2RO_4 TaxID=3027796 RepID=UPI003DA96BCB
MTTTAALPLADPFQVRLCDALCQVARDAGQTFTGTGALVCEPATGLPFLPLVLSKPDLKGDLPDVLLRLGHEASPYHDGFHLLSTDFEIEHVSCYLAPPISPEAELISLFGSGSRFATACFASLADGVHCAGVVNKDRSVTIFVQGRILFRSSPADALSRRRQFPVLARCDGGNSKHSGDIR